MNDKKIREYEEILGMHIIDATATTNAKGKSVVMYKIEGSDIVYEEPYRKLGFLKNEKADMILKVGKYNHAHEYLKSINQAEMEVAVGKIDSTKSMDTKKEDLPKKIKINKKKIKKVAKFILVPVAMVGMFKFGKGISNLFTKTEQPEDANQKNTVVATENVNESKQSDLPDTPSNFVNYEQFCAKCADADVYLNQELGLNVPYETIPSMMFACNCQYMEPADIKILLDDGIVSSSSDNIMKNCLTVKSIVENHNFLEIEKADGKMVNLSCFTINKKDESFANRLYNDIDLARRIFAGDIGTNDDAKNIYNAYFKYSINDISTSYNTTIQECSTGARLIAQDNLLVMSEIGRIAGIPDETVSLLQHKVKENGNENGLSHYEVISEFDISTIISNVKGNIDGNCVPTNEEETNTKSR